MTYRCDQFDRFDRVDLTISGVFRARRNAMSIGQTDEAKTPFDWVTLLDQINQSGQLMYLQTV